LKLFIRVRLAMLEVAKHPTPPKGARMNLHSLARTCPASRALLIKRITDEHWPIAEAAAAAGISTRTAYKWLARFRSSGRAGLRDRSSRPRRMPRVTPSDWQAQIITLRREHRMSSPAIARQLRLPRSTVCRILQRAGISRLSDLAPREPAKRYERQTPGDLVHVDIKKLGRFERAGKRVTGNRRRGSQRYGWEYVHVCIDDYTRLAYVEVLADELGPTCASFFERAIVWFASLGIRIREVISDNGGGYRSFGFAHVCELHSVRHIFTKAYRPQTNGKAERFIQTLLREWAYARPYDNSQQRREVLKPWLRHYNRRRPHGSLDGEPPFARLSRPG
jgi:transposase InsO family protein